MIERCGRAEEEIEMLQRRISAGGGEKPDIHPEIRRNGENLF